MPVYLIRSYSPSFYSFEISFTITATLLCLRLYRTHRNATPLVVLAAGSIAWSIIESLLYGLGTRDNDSSEDGLVDSYNFFGVTIESGIAGYLSAGEWSAA